MSHKKEMSKSSVIFTVSALAVFSVVSLFLLSPPDLASQFGLSLHAANTIIDIAAGSGSIWAILAVVGGSFGWGIALLATARALLIRYGKKAAAAW